MKKSLIIVAMFHACVLFGGEWWTDSSTWINWEYSISNGEVTIESARTQWNGNEWAPFPNPLVIPETIDGKPVTGIGEEAFEDNESIVSVTLPSSLKSIGRQAFQECIYLESITIPSTVTTIGEEAFGYCESLKSIEFSKPSSLTTIGEGAFAMCNLSGGLEIPLKVKTIGDYAFEENHGLMTVTIPRATTSIGFLAFACRNLKFNVASGNSYFSVSSDNDAVLIQEGNILHSASGVAGTYTIPSGIDTIGAGAFVSSKVKEIVIHSGVTSIGPGAFTGTGGSEKLKLTLNQNPSFIYENGILYNKNKTKIIAAPAVSGDLTIPSSVTTIGEYAFSRNPYITSVTIPRTVTAIEGSYTFGDCLKLTNVVLNCASVDKIPNEMFVGCIKLASVTISDGPTQLGDDVFCECPRLKKVTLPSTLKTIGDWAFDCCYALTDVTIPVGVTSMGEGAFIDCESLKSITIPSGVKRIENYTFIRCSDLESVTIQNGVESIGEYAFEDCGKLTEINFPESLTGIGEGAFNRCRGLTSVTIPASVTDVGYAIFDDCSSLTSATIPGSLAAKGQMFPGCNNLSHVTILEGATCIGDSAFSGCSSLTSVTIPEGVTSIGSSAFYCCSSLTSITIPDSVTSIGGHAFYGCSGLTSVTIPDSVTSISDFAFYDCSGLTSVTIPDSVTSVGDRAFYGCSGLTSVTIPQSVMSIDSWAFLNCLNLSEIRIPMGSLYASQLEEYYTGIIVYYEVEKDDEEDGGESGGETPPEEPEPEVPDASAFTYTESNGELTITGYNGSVSANLVIPSEIKGKVVVAIGEEAFDGCANLMSVTIPDSVTRIKQWAFRGCSSLRSVTIPKNVSNIEYEVFFDCSELESVVIPEGVTSIKTGVFQGCSKLTNLTIPETVISLGQWVFKNCSSLTSISIPEGVPTIGREVFSGCTGLKSMIMPNSVTSIDYKAFYDCSSLKEIVFQGVPPSVGSSAFSGVGSGCLGYYSSKYASEWKSVLGGSETGTWNGITMKLLPAAQFPSIPDDPDAEVTWDAETGFVIKPTADKTSVEVTIPDGIDAGKVTVEVSTSVTTIKPNGATVKIVKSGHNITEFLDIPSADASGIIDLTKAVVKEAIVKEVMDPEMGAKFEVSASETTLTTAPTKLGLTYTLREGATLDAMQDGDSKLGDGKPWTPAITVKGGTSGFYTIRVSK